MTGLPQSAVLALVLLIAVVTDIRRHRVYNWLTFPAMVLGVILNAAAHSWPGLGYGVLGLVVGGLVFFPAYYWGGMGAGDIKLMAAVGAFMGWAFAVNTAIYASLAGGLAAVILLAVRGELGRTLAHMGRVLWSRVVPGRNPEPLARSHPLPYAVAIAAGAAAAHLLPPFLIVP